MRVLIENPLIQTLIVSILIIIAYSAGYSIGNRRSKLKSLEEELKATESMLLGQGDSPEQVKRTMEVMRSMKLNELKSEGREYLAIWLPTLLVIINIVVTIIIEYAKQNP